MKKLIWPAVASVGALLVLTAQDAKITISGGVFGKIAIPQFRGAGDAQKFMDAFNETLTGDVRNSGRIEIVPRTSYPLFVPQQPSDFQQPTPQAAAPGRGRPSQPAGTSNNGGGRWMQDWASPPAQATY